MKRGGGRERLTAFVPTSDCRFNCHGMIYVSEGKLIVTNFQLLAPFVLGGAPIFKPRRGGNCPPGPSWPPRHCLLYACFRIDRRASAEACAAIYVASPPLRFMSGQECVYNQTFRLGSVPYQDSYDNVTAGRCA